MVTLSFRIEEQDGMIACHQRMDEEVMTQAEKAVAMLMAMKVAKGIPQWLGEVTGHDVQCVEHEGSLESLLKEKPKNVEGLVEKLKDLSSNRDEGWKERLQEVLEVVPESLRVEIQTKMELLGDTFDISQGFGPLNRVYDQDK